MVPLMPRPVISMEPCITSLWRFSNAALPPVTSIDRSSTVSALGRASSAQNRGTELRISASASLFMVDLGVSFRVPHGRRQKTGDRSQQAEVRMRKQHAEGGEVRLGTNVGRARGDSICGTVAVVARGRV